MSDKPYDRFAEVYDLMGADDFSIKMVDYCFKIFRRFKIEPATGLDLCCGTGTAIAKFHDKGIIMSGLDRSPKMLAMAARKLKGKKVRLYQKSLPKFRILHSGDSRKTVRFDLVTSFFDSLNYLKNERELKTAFRSVHRHLVPGGWFIFDMNTPAAMKTLWGSQVHTQFLGDLVSIWRNDYHSESDSATCHTTFFRKKGKVWERFDEVHLERAYSDTVIKRTLREAGFMVKGYYSCFTFNKPTRRTCRICAIAKKPV